LCATPRESLAAIRVLLDDPQQISNLSARSVHYARRYRWERIAMLHLRLYRAVLDADSGTASALPRQLSSDRARVGEKEIDAEQAIADHPVPRGLV
jgi:hypothetical protein